jgi:hypothetical protein
MGANDGLYLLQNIVGDFTLKYGGDEIQGLLQSKLISKE